MSDEPLIFIAQAVIDAIWWPVMIGAPIYAALIFAGGIAQMSLMTGPKSPPPPPYPK